jgi:phenylacetate-CoA ligase
LPGARARLIPLLRFARRYPRVSREEIGAFQAAELRRLVAHAYADVPYYRRLFDRHGLRPEQIRTPADLAAVPITSKRDIQALPAPDVVARGFDPARLIHHRTSGSTGEPLTIRRTWIEERLGDIFRLRAVRAYGWRLRDRRAVMGIVRDRDPRDHELPQRIARALGFFRKEEIHCLAPPAEIVRALCRMSPDVIGGMPAVLAEVASLIGEGERARIHPRYVVVGGEVLTPLMRQRIGEAFRAPVHELYASHELPLIAWECARERKLHVCEDNVIVEVLNEGRPAEPGETGEVVATRLHAYAMPFIRYRVGDAVTRGEPACPCGQPFATIRAVQGRMLDYFPLADGRVIHPYDLVLTILPRSTPWMRQYQLVQEREDRIALLVVPLTPPSPAEVGVVEDAVRAQLGPRVEFTVRLVPEIRAEPTGKFRVSRSLVRSAYEEVTGR